MHFRPLLHTLTLSLALGGAILPSIAHAQNKAVDDLVLASVNGEEITRRDLVIRLLEYRGEVAREKMISRAILEQEAKRAKVTVTDAEVTAKLTEFRNRLKSEASYRDFLIRSRVTEAQFRDEIHNTLLIQKVALKESPIQDAELEQYDVRIIQAPDEETAAKWIKELDNGANFAQIASQRSVDATLRRAGGRLKPFLRIEMADIWQALQDQKLRPPAGYTKTPVRLANGNWVIVKLENNLPVSTTASATERDRLSALVTAYRIEQWLAQARTKAKVERKPLTEAVIATVNGEPLTRAALVSRLLAYQGEEALEQMANRTLLLQAAKTLKVTVSAEEADAKVAEMRAKFKEADAFQAFLTRSNLTERQLKDDLRYTSLMQKVALKESPITDEDLQRYELRMIVAPNKTAAEKWVKELDAGTDFARMAAERSQDPTGKAAAGRMKPFLKIEMLDVWRAIQDQKLKAGSYTKTPVLLTDNTHALIKLESVIPISAATPEERARLTQVITQYRVDQWLNQARQRAKFGFPVPLAQVINDTK
jgi:foldase protein PrsA